MQGGVLIRILLAQQWSLVRGALASVLASEPDFLIAAEASTQLEALRLAEQAAPDLAVIHHALPGPHDIRDLCVELHTVASSSLRPSAALQSATTSTLIFAATVRPWIGLIANESTTAALIDGVRRIVARQPVFDVLLAVSVLSATNNPLTERERSVLRQALRGAPVGEIAAELFLSAGTVRNYLSSAVSKTGARTRIEAIRIAHEAGWI